MRCHTLVLLAAVTLASLFLAPHLSARDSTEPYTEVPGNREFSGRLVVRPLQADAWQAQGLNAMERLARIAEARTRLESEDVLEYIWQTDETVIRVPEGQTENTLSVALMDTGLFQYAEPDWILYPLAVPDDPRYSQQWHHEPNRMQSADGWDLHTGNSTVSVGICDTGIRTTHEDFQLHRLDGYNAVDKKWESQGGKIEPIHSHGTRVSGYAVANGNNGVGVSGVGWNLGHRMLRVTNSTSGSASLLTLQHAARTAIESGDRIANVSYSGVDSASNLTTATYIKANNGLLFWAAGNDKRNLTYGDRDADDIIVVGATNSSDTLASWFSAYGMFVDLTAPGEAVHTTDWDSDTGYYTGNGTSFACPLAAGLAALIWSHNPSLTPDDVEYKLKTGCDDLGTPGIDNTYGYGRINVYQSLIAPTLVELTRFGAVGFGTRALVFWETESEIDNAGFHIWRSSKARPGPTDFIRITDRIVPSRGTATYGAKYTFVDSGLIPGRSFWYRLEDIEYGGLNTFHKPVPMRWWRPHSDSR